jgi:hypothetical protein
VARKGAGWADVKADLPTNRVGRSGSPERKPERIGREGGTPAVVKVRVRRDTILYLDYLSYHCINGAWLITAKSFHVERRYEPTAI